MNLTAEPLENCLVIHVEEPRIDAAAALEFKETMRGLIESGDHERFILNMAAVDSIDSSGLGAIVAVMKLIGADRKLELCELSTKVQTVFRLTRMDAVVTIHSSLDDALHPLKRAS